MERWLPVVGHEGVYEVSDLGKVRSLDRQVGTRFYRGRQLEPWRGPYGYLVVELSGSGTPSGRQLVHGLVLTAFVGPRPADGVARHIDGDRMNASLTNLLWGTAAENSADQARHGTQSRGETHGRARLTEAQAREALRDHASGVPRSEIAARFGVSTRTIGHLVRGYSWRHLHPGASAVSP